MSRLPWHQERPEPHVFVAAEELDFYGEQTTCRLCALPLANVLHVSAGDLYEPSPEGAVEIDHRVLGETG
jgi:hypothetical protein